MSRQYNYPCLDKVDEIGQNKPKKYLEKIFKTGAILWEKAQCVCTHLSERSHQKALFSNYTTAR